MFKKVAENVLLKQNTDLSWTKSVAVIPKIKDSWTSSFRKFCCPGAFEYYVKKFVCDVDILPLLNEQVAVKGICKTPEKNLKYRMCIVLSTKKIVDAYCECPTGQSKPCPHMGALLYTIYYYQHKCFITVPDPNFFTLTPCNPGPSDRSTTKKKITKKRLQRHKNGCPPRPITFKLSSSLVDPRHPDQRGLNAESEKRLGEAMLKHNKTCHFAQMYLAKQELLKREEIQARSIHSKESPAKVDTKITATYADKEESPGES